MTQTRIKGADLTYHEMGSGEPIVLVHGTASDHRTWDLQREAFAENFRVISFSRRYHWPNEPIPDGVDYSMGEQVEDLQALANSLDAAPAHWVGHSYGAFLCLLLAIQKPSLVRTLVLAEPPVITLFVSNSPKPLELLKLFVTRPRTASSILRLGAKGIAPASKAFERGEKEAGMRMFVDAVLGPGGYDGLLETRKVQVQDNMSNLEAELLGSGFMPLKAEQVRSVRAPTLLLTGEQSAGVFLRLTDRLEELLPQSERIEIPRATHMMPEENVPAFNAAVLEFVKTHRHVADRSGGDPEGIDEHWSRDEGTEARD